MSFLCRWFGMLIASCACPNEPRPVTVDIELQDFSSTTASSSEFIMELSTHPQFMLQRGGTSRGRPRTIKSEGHNEPHSDTKPTTIPIIAKKPTPHDSPMSLAPRSMTPSPQAPPPTITYDPSHDRLIEPDLSFFLSQPYHYAEYIPGVGQYIRLDKLYGDGSARITVRRKVADSNGGKIIEMTARVEAGVVAPIQPADIAAVKKLEFPQVIRRNRPHSWLHPIAPFVFRIASCFVKVQY
ncbi:hypothetical protein EXIGLDRAFT_758817 [Exidia glandulosa HHB12029]|uniref:TonB C-terminal domain-containing protein n=1 Tax=Exidia glandulosa HHB12029 TaxID=1314781 RepID=A0A165QDU3_EXIGL|nr:hypothetical protein EXIGLDRAFT_758817 [Exidia glandulosa HHB12029]